MWCLDESPDQLLLEMVGAINIIWAMVEAEISAALFSLFDIDDLEFIILLGRMEIIPKLKKLEQILKHRNDKTKEKTASGLIREVENLRQDRNALAHGVYQGRSKRGEYAFALMADILFEDFGSSKKMRVFTAKTLTDHLQTTTKLASKIREAFDSPKMRKLHNGRFRIPKSLRVEAPLATPAGKPKSQSQS